MNTYKIGLINRNANAGYGARIFVEVSAEDAIQAQKIAIKNNKFRGYTEIDSVLLIHAN